MLRLVLSLLLRLMVVALLADSGLRALRHGGSGFVVLGAIVELVALITLAMAAIAGAALVEHFHQPTR